MAKMPVRFVVELRWRDFWYGRQCQPQYCPIALATKRDFPFRHVLVGPDDAVVDGVTYAHDGNVLLFDMLHVGWPRLVTFTKVA